MCKRDFETVNKKIEKGKQINMGDIKEIDPEVGKRRQEREENGLEVIRIRVI
uniref:Uncharacterized protein n=1 Tax=Arion vulgaris TaxID=1028688 RepID=A0A0B7A827_9EUPU